MKTLLILLATALSEMEPGVLDMVERDQASWLHGDPRSEAADEASTASRREALLCETIADESHLAASRTLVAALFPEGADAASLERGRRIGHVHYFARYRELDAGL